MNYDYDVLVIGSGFGGSVSALRLTEKGYRVGVLEAGRRFADGSAISANLGVNPSLTITAQAERAMALWPNKGEPDTRPALGEAYEPIAPHQPLNPAVPAHAPAALLLPMPTLRRSD